MSILAAKDISVRLGAQAVLHGVNVVFDSPGIVGVIGPNGAGKTTLLRVVAGVLQPSNGEVLVGNRSMNSWPRSELAKQIAYLPQSRSIAWPLTCFEIVKLGRLPHRSRFAALSSGDLRIVHAAMEQTDVARFAERPLSTLSGGEQARVLIARALAQEPHILLADEPANGLDPAHQLAALDLFFSSSRKKTLVLITMHDLSLAAQWCDRVLVLKDGCLIEDGPPVDVLNKRLVDSVYGIDAALFEHRGRPLIFPIREQTQV